MVLCALPKIVLEAHIFNDKQSQKHYIPLPLQKRRQLQRRHYSAVPDRGQALVAVGETPNWRVIQKLLGH